MVNKSEKWESSRLFRAQDQSLILITLFLLAGIFLFAVQSQAQYWDTNPPTTPALKSPTVINLKSLPIEGFNFWEDEFKGHWAGIHLGVNGLARADYSMYPEHEQDFLDVNLLRSTTFHVNLFQLSKGLQHTRNTVGLVTGLGMELQTYYLDKNTSFVAGDSRIEPVQLYFDNNQKSKFSSIYLNMPLLLEFQVPLKHYKNRLYLSGGITLSRQLGSHTKIKYRKNNQKQKLKTPDDFYTHDFRYSATARLGYRWINLFATYDLRPLFEEGKGPEVYPFSVGLALISF